MPEQSDIEEPPETTNLLKFRIKKFFSKLFTLSSSLSQKETNYTNQKESNNASYIQQDFITKNFESFDEKTVEDVMIPRSDIISVSYDISLEDLSKTIIKYGHTRTLVYKDNLDNVIGCLCEIQIDNSTTYRSCEYKENTRVLCNGLDII